MKGKKLITTAVIALFFLGGLSLLLYPLVANQWNNYRQKRLISSYDSTISQMEEEGTVDYNAEWDRAKAYNEALLPSILPDSFAIAEASEEPDREYLSCLDVTGDGMMGTVEIPKINITLPVYHTTDEKVLERAAGHLEGKFSSCGWGKYSRGYLRTPGSAKRIPVYRFGPAGGGGSLPLTYPG